MPNPMNMKNESPIERAVRLHRSGKLDKARELNRRSREPG